MMQTRAGRMLKRGWERLQAGAPRRGLLTAALIASVLSATSVLVSLTATSPLEMMVKRWPLIVLINLNLVLMAVVLFVLGRNLIKLYLERSRGALGSRFKTKMVVLSALLVTLPTVLMFFTASGFLSNAVDNWFSLPIESVLADSKRLLDEYEWRERQRAEDHVRRVAHELGRRGLLSSRYRRKLAEVLHERREQYRLGLLAAYDRNGQLLATARLETSGERHTDQLPQRDLEELVAGSREQLAVQLDLGDRLLMAVGVPVRDGARPGGALVAGVYVGGEPFTALANMASTYEQYRKAEVSKDDIKRLFVLMLLFFTLVILFSAVWVGSSLAKGITVPVQKLAEGTRAIAEGRLDYRVDTQVHDEFGILIQSFNHMTEELAQGKQRLELSNVELRSSNAELERRRRYIETILRATPSGVVAFDPDGRISNINEAARRMLGVGDEDRRGEHFKELLAAPEFLELRVLVDRLLGMAGQHLTRDLRLRLGARQIDLRISFTGMRDPRGGYSGLVLVMEDLSQLIRAQKVEAWREVAKRVAHEIKNPLTPIRMSAERIRKRTAAIERGSAEVVTSCCDTIVREVDGLKTLVNAFSKFAQMPPVELRPVSLGDVVRALVDSYQGVNPGIVLEHRLEPGLPTLQLDPEQFRRVLSNLIDNAVDCMDGIGRIELKAWFSELGRRVVVEVADEGPGIRAEDRAKLFIPHFSTKARGRGLGLAIVHRIVSDHSGSIRVEENTPRGTRFVIELPA